MTNLGSVEAISAWREGEPAQLEGVDLAESLLDPSVLVWVDLRNPSVEDLAHLGERLRLGPTVIDDIEMAHERPKLTRHADHLFLSVYATALSPDAGGSGDGLGSLRVQRISVLLLPHALVTISRGDAFDVEELRGRWSDNSDLLQYGARALLHGLLDMVVDGYFDTIQRLDDAIEGLEDVLFDERPTGRAFLKSTYAMRKDLVALRRVVLPTREVVAGLQRHADGASTELDAWYDDLYDHVLRASEWTESLRDMVSTVFETNLSLQDSRLNTVMKQLAAWAAVIAVPTAITGWFGQNVPYPGFEQPWGVAASGLLVLLCSVLLYLGFRKRGWL